MGQQGWGAVPRSAQAAGAGVGAGAGADIGRGTSTGTSTNGANATPRRPWASPTGMGPTPPAGVRPGAGPYAAPGFVGTTSPPAAGAGFQPGVGPTHLRPTPPAPGPTTRPGTPLRSTPLSSLVDAASRMERGQRDLIKPATVRNVMMLVAVITSTGVVGGLIAGVRPGIVAGCALIFVGIVTGWSQIASVMAPATPTARNRSMALAVVGALAALLGVLMAFSENMPWRDVLWGALAGMVMILALAVIVAPWWISMVSDLGRQRAATAREELRADFTSRLHDSVLQTLALIQLHADDPAKVAALARGQERDLREWLYGDPDATATAAASAGDDTGFGMGPSPADDMHGGAGADASTASRPTMLSARLKRLAAQVEDAREVPIEVVAVGDCTFIPSLDPLLRAAGEAMVNAAKHGRPPIGVYMEVGGGSAQVFVRDHGDGFDVDAPHEGHLGVSSSIVDRMRRAGGTSQIVSRPGWGTEVRLSMPISDE